MPDLPRHMPTLLLLLLVGCGAAKSTKPAKSSPAKVAKPSEDDIYHVTLTPKATERLGIVTAKIRKERVPRFRTIGGDVQVRIGDSVIVSAPATGMLTVTEGMRFPTPGAKVDAGQALFKLVPMLSPERDVPTPAERVQMANARASLVSAQIVAAGDAKQAQAEVDGAKIALDRAKQLLSTMAGSRRAVEEAQAAYNVSEKKLLAAKERELVLNELVLSTEGGKVSPIPITVPEPGTLRNLTATRGQIVNGGAPLFEVMNLDKVWIRVPVYTGDTKLLDLTQPATLVQLDGQTTTSSHPDQPLLQASDGENIIAKPIPAPPSADPLASTVDVFFEVENTSGKLHPGQRVGVRVPLKDTDESLVVPWAAVLRDIHGTAWVYEQVQTNEFRRRRVFVKYAAGEDAVLAAGPDVGTEIVTDGAAELFGTEFGTGK